MKKSLSGKVGKYIDRQQSLVSSVNLLNKFILNSFGYRRFPWYVAASCGSM